MKNNEQAELRLAKIKEQLKTPIRGLSARMKVLRAAATLRAADARDFHRQMKDRRIASQRNGTRSQQLFGKGATAEKIGYLELDDYAIVGLEAHGALYALWIARAAMETEARNRGDLLRHIFSCPKRFKWCVHEGARICLEFSKDADEEETRKFLERQAKGSKDWRKEAVTEHQQYALEVISKRLDIAIPENLKRGSAYDFIALKKANPEYWRIPDKLPDWEI